MIIYTVMWTPYFYACVVENVAIADIDHSYFVKAILSIHGSSMVYPG